MSKNNSYAAQLKGISYNNSETFDRKYRSDVISEIDRINAGRNAYEFQYKLGSKGLEVTRVVPQNYYNRKLYIRTINKESLTKALRSNKWSKERTAVQFGISPRSIGRMVVKYGIVMEQMNAPAVKTPARKTVSNSARTATKAATKNARRAR